MNWVYMYLRSLPRESLAPPSIAPSRSDSATPSPAASPLQYKNNKAESKSHYYF
jgi:hypothetical protein